MTEKLVVGICGAAADARTVDHTKRVASLIGDCEIVLCFVIEWSPYSFQTPEENASRHQKKEEEIDIAKERVLAPIIDELKAAGFAVSGIVKHGHVAEILDGTALEERALQLIVARSSHPGIGSRIFGSVATKLAASASVPLTIVG